jgi:hypothetical protein
MLQQLDDVYVECRRQAGEQVGQPRLLAMIVASRLMNAVARLPAVSLLANSQFFRPGR